METMGNDIENFARWYKEKRCKFSSNTYIDRSSRIKKILLPYVDWSNAEILNAEINLNTNVFAEIRRRINSSELAPSIPMITLALKNRAEYISSQSDFYPAFAALSSFLFALLGKYLTDLLNLSNNTAGIVVFHAIMTVFFTVVIPYTIYTRIETRHELSHCKELINILELYEKKYSPASRTDNGSSLLKDKNGEQSSHQLPNHPA